MGKKSAKNSTLGRALIKDRFRGHHNRGTAAGDCMLHTTELDSKTKTNYQSVTEESQLDELLYKATMAGQFYETEQQDVRVLKGPAGVGLLSDAEYQKAQETHEKFRDSLKIPRRPTWTSAMSPSILDQLENESFWEWRKSLSKAQEANGFLLTPYEKNLEFWRQLWRVVERSDVVVQIVDARNPLLFRCEDLEKYVKEVSEYKLNMLLVNKADFLTPAQRQLWADYFYSVGVKVAFYSALEPAENSTTEQVAEGPQGSNINDKKELETDIKALEQAVEDEGAALTKIIAAVDALVAKSNCKEELEDFVNNDTRVLSREELIDLFHTMHKGPKVTADITTIGLVGYPNVGKSSTINSLLMAKKVSVSATPGKTKHFQTFYLDNDIILCDCPGLVMPSFVFTRADMVLNGILPIDQMRDHIPPISLVTQRIPRHVLEDMYGIMLPIPREDEEDPQRCSTAEEFLNAYAYNRGFMTAHGQPDGSRAARKVLKDYTSGKLVYCHAPPGVDQSTFTLYPERQKMKLLTRLVPPREARALQLGNVADPALSLVQTESHENLECLPIQRNHAKGVASLSIDGQSLGYSSAKPWKEFNKHKNKGKKEKARRKYAYLDQH
ncbi:large subunit GTPase 1 homolog [Dendroctonus ponderosae]